MVTLKLFVSYKKVNVDKETDDLIKECIDDYKKHNPQFEKIPISRNKIIYEVCKYYLRQKW